MANTYLCITGGPLKTNTVNHHLRRIDERVGVEYLSSHKIRFWSIVNMSMELDPAEVQYMAGHLDPATTDHYRKRVSKVDKVDTDTWNKLYGLAKQADYVNRITFFSRKNSGMSIFTAFLSQTYER